MILREYSKDGTNKRINISALGKDEDNENDFLDFNNENENAKEDNTSNDKSGDQSGSNLSKSTSIKESEEK
jgi:hypothetical protein